MPGYAKVLADSVSPAGVRLTTFELKFPRFLLAQFNTHRQLSRNARSSRAVPTAKLIEEIERDPITPTCRHNQKGMVAGDVMSEAEQANCRAEWCQAREAAIEAACNLAERGVAKETVNRLLEPFMWAYVVASATEWENFFALRTAPDAQPEFRDLAAKMLAAMQASEPVERFDDWHLPYITDDERREYTIGSLQKLSVARCARVSYAPFNGSSDPAAEFARAHRLAESGHWSPFEHQASAAPDEVVRFGNFRGWGQFRKFFEGERRTFAIGGAA